MPISYVTLPRSKFSLLGALQTALISGLFALTMIVPTASAQSRTPTCGGESNRLIRFVGASYVAKNKFCDVERRLGDQLEATKQAEIRAGALSSEKDLALARVAELENQISVAGACRADELQNALDVSRSQNVELLDAQDNLTSQIAGLDLQIEQLRGTISAQQSQLDAAMMGEEGMSAEILRLRAALKASETEALAVRTERDNLQAGYEALGEKSRADASRLGSDLESAVGALSACRADFEAFKANATDTANATGDIRGQLALAQAEIQDLRAKLNASLSDEAAMRSELEAISSELAASTTLAAKLPNASAALKAAEDQVNALEVELQQRKNAAKVAQDALSAELMAEKEANAERDALIADLRSQIARSQAERDADVASLQARLSDVSAEASQVPKLMGDMKNRENRIVELEAQLAGLRENSGDAGNRLAGLQALIGKRATDLDRSEEALRSALSSKAELEGRLRDTSNSLNSTESLLAKAEGELKLLRTHVGSVDASLNACNLAAATRIEALEAELAAALERGSDEGELRAQLQAQEATNENLRIALRNAGLNQSSDTLNIALRQWLESSRETGSEGLAFHDDRLVLSSGASLFQPGSARLSQSGQALLNGMAADLQEAIATLPQDEEWQLQVQGHADATPSGSRWPSNWELSAFRAATVVRTLVDAGLPPERLAAVGMGEFHPLIDEASPAAYAQNRRIELQFR